MDASLYRVVNRFAARTGWLHPLAVGYATKGIAVFTVLLLVGWWLARREGDLDAMATVIGAGAAAIVALGAAQLIGHVVLRPRPYETLRNAHVLVARTADFSFPSD